MGIFHKDKIPSEPIEECIFCQIVKGKVPCKRIAENKNAIAFLDVAPAADGHTLVIPKEHYQDLRSCPENVLNDVIALTKEVANILNNSILKPWGFNYLSNEGAVAGQVVMHFHIHVIPKYGRNEGFNFEVANKCVDDINKVYEKIVNPGKNKFKQVLKPTLLPPLNAQKTKNKK